MQDLDAPLAEDGAERAGIFLTNALTGWEPHAQKPLPFPELEEERDRADQVKQDRPILVILGNPPYNGYAGMAVDEERELSRLLPQDPAGAASRGPGAERPIRALLSDGRTADRREDRTGVSFALSPTIRGWTACRVRGCGSGTWKRLTSFGSTI